jgi:hypothetical protein
MSEISHNESDLSTEQAAVFQVVSRLESTSSGAGNAERIAAEAGMDPDRTRQILDELAGPLGLVTALEDPRRSGSGPVYRAQTRT